MSIDFSKVKSLEIPEGIVTKIVNASGLVLWNAVKMANLTITSFCDGMDGDTARITITAPSPFAPNPNEPNNKVTSWTAYVYDLFDQQNRTIKIPIGSTIECYITRDKGNADSYIKLNGVNVATGEGTYIYTVTGDVTIDVSEDYIQGDFGVISIVGAVTYISFSINGETYQSIEGMTWSAWFASDYNTTGKTKSDVNGIKDANGNAVSMDSVIVGGAVYEVEFINLEIIIDYGVVQGTYNTFLKNYATAINFDGFPEGYDSCTVAVVDGVEYALTPYYNTDTGATYQVVGCELLPNPIGITYDATNGYRSMLILTDGEAHTIQLCKSK